MTDEALRHAVRRLAGGHHLGADEAGAAFDVVMGGGATPAQVAALLMGLRVKGETPAEVAGAARALRRAMITIDADTPAALVDTCGTGGGAVPTFNISTAAALAAAACGVRIAKHGNRSFTSRSGSADLLEALGMRIELTPARMAAILREVGIVFMFAPLMHPAMRHVGPVRRELAIPTVMNMIGPLANPARAGRQVIGVADRNRLDLIAGALHTLGTEHALVVHGEPGMDEISPIGVTHVRELRGDAPVREWTIDPADLGFAGLGAPELAGGEPLENAVLVREVLGGGGNPAARAAVILNAAAALFVHRGTSTYAALVDEVRETLRTGAPQRVLQDLVAASTVPAG
ncbi:MAG: anthranilate phosphoribosyltransferase [Gemmatimonadaceae bacterium]|nr:anthranilate phosphoribosyltransferase [Gemmatimonadaceae bacterium]